MQCVVLACAGARPIGVVHSRAADGAGSGSARGRETGQNSGRSSDQRALTPPENTKGSELGSDTLLVAAGLGEVAIGAVEAFDTGLAYAPDTQLTTWAIGIDDAGLRRGHRLAEAEVAFLAVRAVPVDVALRRWDGETSARETRLSGWAVGIEGTAAWVGTHEVGARGGCRAFGIVAAVGTEEATACDTFEGVFAVVVGGARERLAESKIASFAGVTIVVGGAVRGKQTDIVATGGAGGAVGIELTTGDDLTLIAHTKLPGRTIGVVHAGNRRDALSREQVTLGAHRAIGVVAASWCDGAGPGDTFTTGGALGVGGALHTVGLADALLAGVAGGALRIGHANRRNRDALVVLTGGARRAVAIDAADVGRHTDAAPVGADFADIAGRAVGV